MFYLIQMFKKPVGGLELEIANNGSLSNTNHKIQLYWGWGTGICVTGKTAREVWYISETFLLITKTFNIEK